MHTVQQRNGARSLRAKKQLFFFYFNDFVRSINNNVYFTESKPGVFERNGRFKFKSNFVADVQYSEINLFGWRVCEKISEVLKNG